MGKKDKKPTAEIVTSPGQSQVSRQEEAQPTLSAEMLIQHAMDKGLTTETMKDLLLMRRELKAERAKELYDDAMSALQGEMPVIKKTKQVYQKGTTQQMIKSGTAIVRYTYAPIDSIIEQTKEYISKHGFSYAITTEQSEVEGEIKAICTVKHRAGHSENSTFRVPIDKEAYMTAPQKVGAALTFAKRYAFCNAFGIITGDQDNDANDTEEEKSATQAPAPQAQAKTPTRATTKPPVPSVKDKLPAAHNSAIHASWAEFAKAKGWSDDEREGRRKATLKKLYNVESNNDLTVDQAIDFANKTKEATKRCLDAAAAVAEKPIADLANAMGGEVVEKCQTCAREFGEKLHLEECQGIRMTGECAACLAKR